MFEPQINVGILIFDGVEVLDFAGPYEVFSVTRLLEGDTDSAPFRVLLFAADECMIQATGGMRVLPDCSMADCPELDVLVVPGGKGVRKLIHDTQLAEWIATRAQSTEIIASVCTGAMLLGRAGLLRGLTATTHWRSLDWMQSEFPETTVDRVLRVIDTGRIVTSAGISAGMDMALGIVARLLGEAIARHTACVMEYRWTGDEFRGTAPT